MNDDSDRRRDLPDSCQSLTAANVSHVQVQYQNVNRSILSQGDGGRSVVTTGSSSAIPTAIGGGIAASLSPHRVGAVLRGVQPTTAVVDCAINIPCATQASQLMHKYSITAPLLGQRFLDEEGLHWIVKSLIHSDRLGSFLPLSPTAGRASVVTA